MVWFYKLIAFILAFFIYSPVSEFASYTTSEENTELTFTVLSDVHLEGNNEDRFNLFGEGIRDINANVSNDFIVFLGDNTMNGQVVELSAFYSILDEYNTIDTYMVTGNHDLCPSDYNTGDYEDLRDRFFKYKNVKLLYIIGVCRCRSICIDIKFKVCIRENNASNISAFNNNVAIFFSQ